jgi:phospholipase C
MSTADEQLQKIEHIVVLMLENRSFDHMLGYLSLEGGRTDINGLKAGMSNPAGGQHYPVHHLTEPEIGDLEQKVFDPDHSAHATDHQINNGLMNGFASSYAHVLEKRGKPVEDAGFVMGYYNAQDLPVYDHLAAQFCVCDQWHSSVPGATWPNRLYAVAGRADGSRDDKPKPPPLYNLHSFVRHLDAHDIDWRWYSFDPATLRCVDEEYLLAFTRHHRFRFFDKTALRWQTAAEELPVIDELSASFIEDAARGNLPPVSWIDPNFNDLNLWGAASNDDHPPSDVMEGQELVLRVYNALATSPQWDKTMLIVTYDEHGGFHDHVPPPEAPDDDPQMRRYGIRVPALIVSPLIEPGSVSHTLFDHTSIIKTILTRFCPEELEHYTGFKEFGHWLRPGHPHYMGLRTAQANHLGELLTRTTPRPPPDRVALTEIFAARRASIAKAALTAAPGQRQPQGLSDLQTGIAAAARELRKQGLPPGHP